MDIKLSSNGSVFDVSLANNDIETDDSLNTAIILSLFLDRRITAEEAEEYGFDVRKGFWADALTENDLHGSKLWTLKREKITSETLKRAKEYCEEALSWLVKDGIADSVNVSVEVMTINSIGIAIEVTKPNDKNSQKYSYLWNNL